MPITFAKRKEQGESGSYQPVADKLYAVKGFEYIHKEDEEPCFRPNVFEQLVVLIKFLTVSGEEGPAMSVSAAELVCLVNAFGAEDFRPDPKRIMDIDTMLLAKEKANSAGKHLSVEGKGGWVKNYDVKWLHPPKDRYTLKFKRIQKHSDNEFEYKKVTLNNGDLWEFIPLVFEVVGDENGKPSPFNGFEIQHPISNVWATKVYDEDLDEYVSIEDIGEPRPAEGVNADRWLALLDYLVPEVHEHTWLRTGSPFGVDELHNPHYVILSALKESSRTFIAYCEENKKSGKWVFDLKDAKLINKNPEKETGPITLQTWVDLVNSVEWDQQIFASIEPLEFTEFGNGWATEYLDDRGPVKGWWNAANLPPARNFDVLTPVEIGRLIEVTKSRMGL